MNPDLHNQQINNTRRNIINTLYLFSSKEEQLNYQENVPIAHVSAELFCQWDEYFLSEKNEGLFREAFNEDERMILSEFNEVFERVAETTPDDLPDIHDFIKTVAWVRLSKAASIALKKLSDVNLHQ